MKLIQYKGPFNTNEEILLNSLPLSTKVIFISFEFPYHSNIYNSGIDFTLNGVEYEYMIPNNFSFRESVNENSEIFNKIYSNEYIGIISDLSSDPDYAYEAKNYPRIRMDNNCILQFTDISESRVEIIFKKPFPAQGIITIGTEVEDS